VVSWKISATDFSSQEGRVDITSDTVVLNTTLLLKVTTPLLTIISGVSVDGQGAPLHCQYAYSILSLRLNVTEIVSLPIVILWGTGQHSF
jgi:hypothetical protein